MVKITNFTNLILFSFIATITLSHKICATDEKQQQKIETKQAKPKSKFIAKGRLARYQPELDLLIRQLTKGIQECNMLIIKQVFSAAEMLDFEAVNFLHEVKLKLTNSPNKK